MRKVLLSFMAALAITWLLPAQTSPPKPAPAKRRTAHKSTTAAATSSATKTTAVKSSSARSTSKRQGTTTRRTARSYQQTPTPERYQEIQQALAKKGYFQDEANGQWGTSSVDALKRFQSDQNLMPDGKLNSLSLIALGLGPKRLTAQSKSANPPPPAPAPQ